MGKFIDLSRRFRDLTESDLADAEMRAAYGNLLRGDGWPELLKNRRVILLAEAGAGKTREMQEQVNRLIGEGKYGFFVAIEELDRDQLIDAFSGEQERHFAAWKADGQSLAWFFLDAVDELKLTQGKLERALTRFAKAIDGAADRAHIVISCRPADWRPQLDLATAEAKLPLPSLLKSRPPQDEVFLAPLLKEKSKSDTEEPIASAERFRTVALLPLSPNQIETFARHLGVNDPGALIAEIEKENAWTFARRPLDLSELVTTWITKGRLGTRAEQHEANAAAKLRDRPDRPDSNVLSEARAREGAERLALALALTKMRTIRSPEQVLDPERAEGVLDAAHVLSDWTDAERTALLRRAMFDPATYGRVRFHHRSVQEYLAASHLQKLREKGLPIGRLLRFFFAESYGLSVVRPSMREIAAWLAVWNEDVKRELIVREPETLLAMGDPESVSLETRASLLRSFARAYGKGGWRSIDIPIDEVRRLAHPELASVVRELWGDGPANDDLRELLLKVIWKGAIVDCSDIAERAAHNAGLPYHDRAIAVWALIACRRTKELRAVVGSMLATPADWPVAAVRALIGDLFPKFMSAAELVTLLERYPESTKISGGFEWRLREIVGAIEPQCEPAVELRKLLADLIWRGRHTDLEWHRITGRFDYIAPPLASLCERQIAVRPNKVDADLIRACVITNRFADTERRDGPLADLKKHFTADVTLRERAFWEELSIMDQLIPTENAWDRLFHVEHDSLIGYFRETDRPWLEAALADVAHPSRRAVALQELLVLWAQRGRVEAEAEDIRNAVQDNAQMAAEAASRTAPAEPDPRIAKFERDHRRHEQVSKQREAKRVADWKKWREELVTTPDDRFDAAHVRVTIENLCRWLQLRHGGQQTKYSVWDEQALAEAFGPDIAKRAAVALRNAWREEAPIAWSRRPPTEQNNIPWRWIYGLTGVACEATAHGWAKRLLPQEARIAAAYATIELNGFPAWLQELAVAYPEAVDEVIGAELSAELDTAAAHLHLPTLQNVVYAETEIKRVLAPRLWSSLENWPSTFEDEEAKERLFRHLEQVVRILVGISTGADRDRLADLAEIRFKSDPSGWLSVVWLRTLFRLDPQRATLALEEGLRALNGAARRDFIIRAFAAVFGHRDGVLLDIADPEKRAIMLGRLLQLAYGHIRPDEDQRHEEVYSPNARDDAETARNFLLSALLDTPGPVAYRVMMELAADGRFSHFADRLRYMARQRAATDAELPPFKPEEITILEARFEVPPHSRDELFEVMMDRIDDLAHDISHDDFNDRRTLRTIGEEIEMQRTLARRIRDAARGAYTVTREDEVADQKRTDIRLAAVRGDQRGVIEIKIADDRWSLADLQRALRDQLVGQYLRHQTCKAGCLLLTYNGAKKSWRHPETKKKMSFADIVAFLEGDARRLEEAATHNLCIAVRGLDLTDPPLVPAHR